MGQYRKKPVQITAYQFDGTVDGMNKIRELFPNLETLFCEYDEARNKVHHWKIETLEDGHMVSAGDFIIQGVKGEFYPCKPEIFALTYEAVD